MAIIEKMCVYRTVEPAVSDEAVLTLCYEKGLP